MKQFFLSLFLCPVFLFGADRAALNKAVSAIRESPFYYDLSPVFIPAKAQDAPVLLSLHGMGGDASIGQVLHTFGLPYHIVSFNFPDYSFYGRRIENRNTTFGTIQELLPFLYVLKKLILEGNLNSINLYGFSAGGGALINGLAVLNSNRFSKELQSIGINPKEKEQMLRAIQNGTIILDAPLKSMRELMRKRKDSGELKAIAKRYETNNLEPIDSLALLSPLSLHVIVYFEVPDNAVLNDDDDLFEQRLRQANSKGTSLIIRGHSGGHLEYHKNLWQSVKKITTN